jgi:hypothetical protein
MKEKDDLDAFIAMVLPKEVAKKDLIEPGYKPEPDSLLRGLHLLGI